VVCEAEKEETKVSGDWVLLAESAAGVLCCEFALQAQSWQTRFRFNCAQADIPASVLEQAWSQKKPPLRQTEVCRRADSDSDSKASMRLSCSLLS